MGKLQERTIVISIILCVIILLMPVGACAASTYSDISNHWNKEKIESWADKGYVSGYADGTFKPDQYITRAEFMTLVNKAFNFTDIVPIDYSDVNPEAWYGNTVSRAKAAGYISGYPDGTMKPDNTISREEAASIILRLKNLVPNEAALNQFTDAANITWSKGAVGALANAGIMLGYPDGTFLPQKYITRAEAVAALSKALGNTEPEETVPEQVTKPGTSSGTSTGGGDSSFLSVYIRTISDTTVIAGATTIITVTTSPSNANITAVSSDTAVAAVSVNDRDVTITGVAPGTSTVTVTCTKPRYRSATKTFLVTVPILVQEITVTGDANEVVYGETAQMNAAVLPVDAADQSVEWSVASLADGTATIDAATGVLTATGVGTVIVTATARDGSAIKGTTVITIIADLTGYNAALSAVVEADYTTASWAVYQAIVDDNVVTNQNLQSEVDTATANITAAQANLIKLADLTAYNLALSAVVEADYTTASWAIYQAVVDENVVTEQNLQSEVDTATANITAGQANLIEIADLTAYNLALSAVVEADYTTASWAIYQAVVDENVVTEQNLQSEVDTATANITAGQANLIEIADLTAYNLALSAVVEADYTTASWAIYQAVVDENIVTDQNLQSEVDTATANIAAAQANLIEMSVMGGTVTITGVTKFGQTLEADITGITYTPATAADIPKYQWERDGEDITGATTKTYTLAAEDIGKVLTVTVTADGDNAAGSVLSAGTAMIAKADGPAAPEAPTAESKTSASITLAANPLHEFNIDGGGWQDSNIFTGLDPEMAYDFTARIKATITHEASNASAPATITTSSALVTGITVTGTDDITKVVNGGTLQMIAAVEPEDALDDSVTWSVVAGSGNATINGTGLLTGTQVGTVTVKATANDASGKVGTLNIEVVKSYLIGDTGQSGGLVFYDKGDYSDGWQYLEAATVAQDPNKKWSKSYHNTVWSNISNALGVTETAVGTGQANTAAIIGQAGHIKSAAKICDDFNYYNMYDIYNYNDWFLPSQDELALIYQNLYMGGHEAEFVVDEIVPFDPFYWSSSEELGDTAYGLVFCNPPSYQNWYPKNYGYGYVRPVRAF